jgi:uncharacterized protein (TIGR03435 family)
LPLIVSISGVCHAQFPSFEAASVKAVDLKAAPSFGTTGGPGTNDPGRIHFRRAPMIELLASAYDLPPDRISGGPSWVRDFFGPNLYEVVATMPSNTGKRQFQLMLQNLLVERFNLKVHHAVKNFPGYTLVVAPGGAKLKSVPSSDADLKAFFAGNNAVSVGTSPARKGVRFSRDSMQLVYRQQSMGELATDLQFAIAKALGTERNLDIGSQRPRVADKTGLDGKYDFTLEFSCLHCGPPQLHQSDALTETISDPPIGGQPDIFEALKKQLGLKLEKVKDVPLDVIVVDQVSKNPIAN